MNLKKLEKHFVIILAVSLVTFFFSTCEIGLGAAVDTEAPNLSILIPNPDKVDVIRGDFPVSGTWSDDGTIASVEVTISSGDKAVLKENAEVVKNENEVGKGSWSYIVSPSTMNLTDGAYGVSVKIKDKAGHFSTASGQIIVDNTAPLVILERPSTYVDSSDIDAFGETLSLLGQVADETGVSKVSMNVFSDKECQNSLLSKPIDFTSVTNLDETVAKFEAGNNENIYYQLYGQSTKDGAEAKTLYFTITSYDGAHRYPVDGNVLPDDDLGNVSTTYYLSSAVSSLVGEYTINGLYKILNGTYSSADRSALTSVFSQLDESKIPVGCFSLNPKNNPTFVVSGKPQLPESNTSESLEAYFALNSTHIKAKTSVQIEVSPGLDGIGLDLTSLKPYVQLFEGQATGDKIYLDVTNTSMSGSVCKMEVPLIASKEKGFSVGKNYKFGVDGYDKAKNAIADSGRGYAFHFSSSGDGPKLSVTEPALESFYKAMGEAVVISGTVEYEETGSLSVSMSPVSSGEETLITLSSATNADGIAYNADASGKIFTFTYEVPVEKFKTDKSEEYTLVVSALADGITNSVQKTVKYDVKLPEITLDEPSPKAKLYTWESDAESGLTPNASSEDYLNGSITFSVTVEDDLARDEAKNLPLVTLKGQNKTQTFNVTQFPTQAFTVDTKAFGDGAFTLTVDAYDLAGNKNTITKNYEILQETNKPFIVPAYPIVTKNYYFNDVDNAIAEQSKVSGGTDLYFRVIDDDDPDSDGSGLKSISIALQRREDEPKEDGTYDYTQVLTSDGKSIFTDTKFYTNNDGSAYKYTLPERSGTYRLTATVTDNDGSSSTIETYFVIKAANPKISSFTLGKEYVSESVNLPVYFEITSDQLPFRITKEIKKDDDSSICNFEDYGNLTDITFEDDRLTKISDTKSKYVEDISIEKGLLSEHKYESGSYKIQYRVFDKNGSAVTSSVQSFKVDLDGPTITGITVPTVDETEEASLNFEIKARDSGAGVANYYIYFASDEITDTSTIADTVWRSADSSYSQSVTDSSVSPVFASSGKKYVYAYTKDSVGNKSAVSSEDFDYDTRKPNASINVPENNTVLVSSGTDNRYNTGSAFSLSGSAGDDWSLESLTLIQTCEGGTNEIPIDLSGQSGDIKNFNWTVENLPRNPTDITDTTTAYVESGVYTYTLKAVDKANKTKTSDAIVVEIDKESPVISVDSIASSGLLSGSAAVFTGTVSDVGLGVDKVLYVIKTSESTPSDSDWTSAKEAIVSTGKWRIEQSLGSGTAGNVITRGDLQEGEYWLYVRAKDKAGNISVNEENTPNPLHFIVDQGKPEVLSASLTVKQAVENSADVLVYQSQTLSSSSTAYINADYSSHKFIIEGVIKETYGLPEDWLSVKVGGSEVSNPAITKDALTGTDNGKYSYSITLTLTGITASADVIVPVEITVSDLTGKTERRSSVTYNIYNDKAPPSLLITNPANDLNESNYITGSSFIFSADVSDAQNASGLKDNKFKYLFTKTPFADEAAIKASAKTGTDWTESSIASGASWSLTKDLVSGTTDVAGKLNEGLWYLYLYAIDKVGNEATSVRFFWIDQANPELTLSSSGSETTKTDFSLSMTASDANGIKSIKITDNYTLADGTTGSHTYNVYDVGSSAYTSQVTEAQDFTLGPDTENGQLKDGLHNFTIVTKDRMDRETSKNWSVLVDTTMPTGSLTLANPAYSASEANWYKNEYVGLTVSANDGTGNVSGVAKVEAAVTAKGSESVAEPSWIELPKSGDSYKNSIQLLSQGANTITIRVTDKAGNVVTENTKSKTAYWDSQVPAQVSITKLEVGTTEKSTDVKTLPVNGREAITITFTASDNAPSSGIKSCSLKKPVETAIAASRVTEGGDSWTAEIPVEKIKTGIISINVEDNVGNISTTTSDINIVLDNTPPVVKKINLPLDADSTNMAGAHAAGVDVNGNVSLSGTVSDNRSTLQSLDVYYYVDYAGQQNWVQIYHGTDANWSVENAIDTKALTTANVPDGTAIYIVPVAIDEVGNCNLDVKDASGNVTPCNSVTEPKLAPSAIADSNKAVIYLNQDSDRPVITIDGMSFVDVDEQGNTTFTMSSSDPKKWDVDSFTGSVADDDGVESLEYKIDSGSWTSVTDMINSSFTVSGIPDGKHTIVFSVKDTTNSTAWENPKITDGTNYAEALYLQADITPPEIKELKFKRSESEAFDNFVDGATFGGTSDDKRQFFIQISAYDENGISSITARLETNTKDSNTLTDTAYVRTLTLSNPSGDEKNYDGVVDTAFNVNGMASGLRKLTIEVSDGIQTSQTSYQINIDNDAPNVKVTSHEDGQLVLTKFMLKGGFTGGDTDPVLKYIVSKSETMPTDWSEAKTVANTTSVSWQVTFDRSTSAPEDGNGGTLDENGYSHDSEPKYLVTRLTTNPALVIDDSGSVVKAGSSEKYTAEEYYYFHFLATDAYGNSANSTFKLRIDPQGETPIVSLTYPAKEVLYEGKPAAYLSGKIRASGRAETINALKGVYVQVDPTYDPTEGFSEAWDTDDLPKEENGTSIGSITDNATELGYEIETIGNTTKKGIKISPNASWNITLNNHSEFEKENGNNFIAIRFYAVDVNNNVSSSDNDIFIIRLDAGAPEIGSSVPLQLKQFNADGTTAAVKNFTDNMWLSGKWYLTGSVEDESGISSITINNTQLPDSALEAKTWGQKSGYIFKYEIGDDTEGKAGKLEYEIKATESDANKKESSQTITIRYDNKAPGIEGTTGSNYNISTNVVNSNGFYTVQSGATEGDEESGFKMAVFYFKRTISGYENVYDSYLKRGATGNTIAQSSLTQEDGLYWKAGSLASENAVSGSNVIIDSADENVHAGGLAKLGGIIYRIERVSGTTLTLDSSIETDEDLNGKPIYFAIGHVVDYVGSESEGSHSNIITDDSYYGYYKNKDDGLSTSDDDGDHMIETVSTLEGASYSVTKWAGTINSSNIPDGPVEIHYVVFDNAGNYTAGVVENAYVQNNAPRLAGLTVTSGSTEDTFYYGGLPRMINGQSVKKATGLTDRLVVSGNGKDADNGGTAFMTIKAGVRFTPELVGGNGNLYYSFYVKGGSKDNIAQENIESKDSPRKVNDVAFGIGTNDGLDDYADSYGYHKQDIEESEYYEGHNVGYISFSNTDLGTLGADSSSQNPTWFYYTIWDSTEGTTPCTNSQHASFECALAVDYFDKEAPSATISPLYWNSSTDNSLYNNSRDNGHIELKEDLTDQLKDSPYGEGDKVSGKITMRGTAKDNIQVDSIWVNIDGFTGFTATPVDGFVKVAEFVNGTTWDNQDNMATQGWACNVENVTDSTDEDVIDGYHKIKWAFSFDTEKIPVGKDVKFYLKVQDDAKNHGHKNEAGTLESLSSTVDENTTYTMDVVPYITRVITSLSSIQSDGDDAVYGKKASVFDRTALGHYPVYYVTKVKTGATNPGGETVHFKGFNIGSNPTYTVGAASSSGEYTLTVNGINSINNINSSREYNLLPNNDNNNNLDDNVYFDVWQFNSAAAIPGSGKIDQAAMKINPVNDQIGFAFVNGSFKSDMAMGTNGRSNTVNSYQEWMIAKDFCTSTAFTYDKNGYSYGVMAGGDTGDMADKYNFITSRWGIDTSTTDGMRTRNGIKSLRMEELRDDTVTFEKQRFVSSSMATAVHDDGETNVYLAYYDASYSEIRFRAGNINEVIVPITYYDINWNNYTYGHVTFDGTLTSGMKITFCDDKGNPVSSDIYSNIGYGDTATYYTAGNVDHNGTDWYFTLSKTKGGKCLDPQQGDNCDNPDNKAFWNGEYTLRNNNAATRIPNQQLYIKFSYASTDKREFGMFKDSCNTDKWRAYSVTRGTVQLLSDGSNSCGSGPYVSIGVVSEQGETVDDVVVATWYDAVGRTLWYSYNTTPTVNRAGGSRDDTTLNDGWSTPVRVFSSTSDEANAGEYCKIAVDANGGVHIAAFDSANNTVVYAYLDSAKKGAANAQSDFDTCLVDGNAPVGEYLTLDVALADSSASVGTPYIGYYSQGSIRPKMAYPVASPTLAGTDSYARMTGNWEITVVPTPKKVETQSNQHNPINIGVWKNKDTGVLKESTNETSSGDGSSGKCYGNGTANPVLGYVITDDTIETAQKK